MQADSGASGNCKKKMEIISTELFDNPIKGAAAKISLHALTSRTILADELVLVLAALVVPVGGVLVDLDPGAVFVVPPVVGFAKLPEGEFDGVARGGPDKLALSLPVAGTDPGRRVGDVGGEVPPIDKVLLGECMYERWKYGTRDRTKVIACISSLLISARCAFGTCSGQARFASDQVRSVVSLRKQALANAMWSHPTRQGSACK